MRCCTQIISPQLDRLGRWAIEIADFSVEQGKPALPNIETLRPGDLQVYETHGFSPDGRSILFSGIPEGGTYYDFEIYLFDLATRRLSRLTENHEWDEQAHFRPDGTLILYGSTEGGRDPPGEKGGHPDERLSVSDEDGLLEHEAGWDRKAESDLLQRPVVSAVHARGRRCCRRGLRLGIGREEDRSEGEVRQAMGGGSLPHRVRWSLGSELPVLMQTLSEFLSGFFGGGRTESFEWFRRS